MNLDDQELLNNDELRAVVETEETKETIEALTAGFDVTIYPHNGQFCVCDKSIE